MAWFCYFIYFAFFFGGNKLVVLRLLSRVYLKGYCFSPRNLMVMCNVCSFRCLSAQLALWCCVRYLDQSPRIQVSSSKYAEHHPENYGEYTRELGMEPALGCLPFRLGGDQYTVQGSGRRDGMRNYMSLLTMIPHQTVEVKQKNGHTGCKLWTESWNIRIDKEEDSANRRKTWGKPSAPRGCWLTGLTGLEGSSRERVGEKGT